ncbi:MAG: hypothetical protein GXP38_09115 [Chloroflexi bacterium]|nr:hypothetical protein [Chloroflexota bacterium]
MIHRLFGAYLKWLYDLERHQWLETSLFTWLVAFLLLLTPLLGLTSRHLGISLLLVGIVICLRISRSWGRRHYYVHFIPTASAPPTSPQQPLWPADKLLLHVSGHLEVEGKEEDFTHLIAYYRTFETREHAIMARQTPSRFLLGETPSQLLGMWYLFITPQELKKVEAGELYFGMQSQPALRLRITRLNDKGKPVEEVAYLGFDSEEDRARVWQDLLIDIGGPAARPWRPNP